MAERPMTEDEREHLEDEIKRATSIIDAYTNFRAILQKELKSGNVWCSPDDFWTKNDKEEKKSESVDTSSGGH
jgi:hypothetical protein